MTALKKANAKITESPAFEWVRKEKVRTSHTGLGVGHLAKLMPVLAKLGFNTIDPGSWRYAAKPEGWEPAVKGTNDLAEKYNMHVTLWLPWYWYKNDKYFPDRNCAPDLTREGQYRRAVDFHGKKIPSAPCPLSDSFWCDLRANVLQVEKKKKKYPHIEGICLDFEFYGSNVSRQSSDWYSYDFCFCDECFNRFLRRIGSKLRACQIPPERRFALLKEAGTDAVQAYYELLADEVRHRAIAVREAAHAINPDFVLQFYGVPIEPDNNVADWLEKSLQFKSWFGFALAKFNENIYLDISGPFAVEEGLSLHSREGFGFMPPETPDLWNKIIWGSDGIEIEWSLNTVRDYLINIGRKDLLEPLFYSTSRKILKLEK